MWNVMSQIGPWKKRTLGKNEGNLNELQTLIMLSILIHLNVLKGKSLPAYNSLSKENGLQEQS
jgi:hypothetical protein